LFSRDFEFLYALALAPEVAWHWRYKGTTPSPDQFIRQLWEGVAAQYVVEPRSDHPAPQGLVCVYNMNSLSRFAYHSLVMAPDSRPGLGMEASIILLESAFRSFGLRKIYMEVPGYNLDSFESSIRRGYLVEEGRLIRHELLGGTYHDLHILALYRETFYERMARLRRSIYYE
jgi:RimJ/RimL family protein N-acetyltransferase